MRTFLALFRFLPRLTWAAWCSWALFAAGGGGSVGLAADAVRLKTATCTALKETFSHLARSTFTGRLLSLQASKAATSSAVQNRAACPAKLRNAATGQATSSALPHENTTYLSPRWHATCTGKHPGAGKHAAQKGQAAHPEAGGGSMHD